MAHQSARTVRAITALLAAFALALFGVAGLGASVASATTSITSTTWTAYVGEQNRSGAIQGMQFLPGTIWIHTGDSVRWVAESAEPHTVSFIDKAHPAVPFSLSIPYMVNRTKQTSIGAPGQFRNSGILTTMPDPSLGKTYSSYTLRFTAPGVYTYLCYLHGRAMTGTVRVATGGRLPHTQGYYTAQFLSGRAADIADGLRLWDVALDRATNHHVYVGAADMRVLLMRFVRPTVYIHVGETVTFDTALNAVPVPHTVTIGAPPAGGPGQPLGNPTAVHVGQRLNSGILFPAMFHVPGTKSSYQVRFVQVGTYHYYCMFHDSMGMTGTVVVLH